MKAGHSLGVPICARNVFGQFRTFELHNSARFVPLQRYGWQNALNQIVRGTDEFRNAKESSGKG